jgi:hypothetical protein
MSGEGRAGAPAIGIAALRQEAHAIGDEDARMCHAISELCVAILDVCIRRVKSIKKL